MKVGYTYSITGEYRSAWIDIVLGSGREVSKGDLVYVEHPKTGKPVLYQVTQVYSHRETRDYEEALMKEDHLIIDDERTTVRARAYEWGWMDDGVIRPLKNALLPNQPVYKAKPEIIELFTKPSSGWKVRLGRDLSNDLDVELDLYHLIRQCCLICGAVGTGKTTTAISMIARAAKAEPPVTFFIVDKDGEYESLQEEFDGMVKRVPWFSFFQAEDVRFEDILSELGWQAGWWTSKVLLKAFNILKKAHQSLTKTNLIDAVYAVSVDDVGFRRSTSDLEGYKRQVVEGLKFSRMIPDEVYDTVDPVDLLRRYRIVIMDLSSGANGWTKKHLVLTQVLTRIFHRALDDPQFGCVVVLEEAMYYAPQWTQFSLGDKDGRSRLLSIVKEIATNGGRNGVGLWVVTQRLATVDKTVITQCANNIIAHALEDIDRKRLQEIVGDEFVELLGSLPQGEAIVKGTALKCKYPIIVRVEPELKPTSAANPPIVRFSRMASYQRGEPREILA